MNKATPHSAEQDTLARVGEQRRTIEALSRLGPEGIEPERLMHHVAAQVPRVTKIKRTKVMRYRPDKGDLLIEAGVGWGEGSSAIQQWKWITVHRPDAHFKQVRRS
jgi:hypothetical protein